MKRTPGVRTANGSTLSANKPARWKQCRVGPDYLLGSTDTDIPRRTGSSVDSSIRASTTGRSRSTTTAAGSPKTPVSPTGVRYHNHRPNAQRPSALRPMDARRSDRCRRVEAGPGPAFATCATSKLIAPDTEGQPHIERRNHSGRSRRCVEGALFVSCPGGGVHRNGQDLSPYNEVKGLHRHQQSPGSARPVYTAPGRCPTTVRRSHLAGRPWAYRDAHRLCDRVGLCQQGAIATATRQIPVAPSSPTKARRLWRLQPRAVPMLRH